MTDFETMCRNFDPDPEVYTKRCTTCGSEFEYNHQYGAQQQKCPDCRGRKSNYVKVGRRDNNPVVVVGIIQQPGVPQDDYSDYWTGQEFSFDEVKYMVELGSFTPGIVLYREGAKRVIVVGENENQEVRVI